MIRKLIEAILLIVMLCVLGAVTSVAAQAQEKSWSRTPVANASKGPGATQQPLFTEYKGVRIGMAAEEARAKLGQAVLKGDDQDFYVFSAAETAQIEYEAHKVIGISVDYIGGVGAPDYRYVIGGNAVVEPDGAIHKLVRYDQARIWVSYNRTPGAVVTVTITLHKFR
jgi:hypothetical protein